MTTSLLKRLWKSIKYEAVYLRAYDTVTDAKDRVRTYLDLHNRRRSHQSLDGRTPDAMYFANLPQRLLAA